MRLKNALKGQFRKEDGSFSVEAILMFPMLVWAFMAMFVFFEGLREKNINLKATYTVADLLSRQTEDLNMTDLNGFNQVYAWLTKSRNPVAMRVTVVRYDEATDSHVNYWSRGVNGIGDLTQANVDDFITPKVPIMADASYALVVETWSRFEPIMDIGLTDRTIYNLVVTAPRFSPKIDFEGIGDGTGTNHDDDTDEDDDPTNGT